MYDKLDHRFKRLLQNNLLLSGLARCIRLGPELYRVFTSPDDDNEDLAHLVEPGEPNILGVPVIEDNEVKWYKVEG